MTSSTLKNQASQPSFKLPVSKNSYNRLVGYINTVFANDPNCRRIVKALDHYLQGDREFYLDKLPREYRMAFQMLIFEIEAAMRRSENARQRAISRRHKVEEPRVEESTTVAEPSPARSETSSATETVSDTCPTEPLPNPSKPSKKSHRTDKPRQLQPYQHSLQKKKFTIRKLRKIS